jgi:hypothetical protein
MDVKNTYFSLYGRDWDLGNGNMLDTGGYYTGSSTYDRNLSDAANNTGRNRSDQRATLQFVAIRQEYKGEPLWKSHEYMPLFRLLDPHDEDEKRFLQFRNDLVEKNYIPSLITDKALQDLYWHPPKPDLRTGAAPYGRFMTVPQLNYSLCGAQLVEGKEFTLSDIWSAIRPTGICVTSEASQDINDGICGDLRVITVGGPDSMHNCFGKDVEVGHQWGVLFKPVKCAAGDVFHFRVSIDGKKIPVKAVENSPCVKNGFFWQLQFYSCEQNPHMSEYTLITANQELITGSFMRLGRIQYDFTEAPFDYFAKDKNSGFNSLLASTDMLSCSRAPLIKAFWDPVQKAF